MRKKMKSFPTACSGCSGVYTHWDIVKLYSGGCMKSFGNSYCTKSRRHFKLLKRNLYQQRPPKCPILNELPIMISDEESLILSERNY